MMMGRPQGRGPGGRPQAGQRGGPFMGLSAPVERSKDFRGTLLRFVNQILRSPRARRPQVEFDFWQQFDAAEQLEELRLFRPSIYKALPEAM